MFVCLPCRVGTGVPNKLQRIQIRVLFGLRLRQIRREQNLSQGQLAKKVDATRQYISMLERGENSPTLDMIFDLAGGLEVHPSEFLGNILDLIDQI